jgi:hypothetical protein
MRSPLGAGIAALTFCVLPLTGCGASADTEIGLCSGELNRVDVYNYFGDHATADYQVISKPADLDGLCEDVWAHLAVQNRTFDASQLGKRSVTVLAMHFTNGASRTVWVDRLPGFRAGVALFLDTGESYFLANQDVPPYYVAAAEPIDRDRVPQR